MRHLIGRSLVSAIVLILAASVALPQTAPAETAPAKKYKDQAEYDLFNGVTKDFAAKNYAKALSGIETWKEKYPESDFKIDRQLLAVQIHFAAQEPAKTIEAAAPLLAADPDTTLHDPGAVIRLLYAPTAAIQRIPDPTPEQQRVAESAARKLLAFDRMPAGMAEADWQRAQKEFHALANGALLYMKLVPIIQAMKAKDCPKAETLTKSALEEYPNSGQLAWYLGSAAYCQFKDDPAKVNLAIYEFARAASLDPAVGMVDAKWQKATVEPNLATVYEFVHGADADGLKQLQELAVKTPLPPDGFAIKAKAQIAQEKQQKFEREHPELALWLKIKAALQAENGDQYFVKELKGAAVPQLLGILVGATPECRPSELTVAIRTSEDQPLTPDIVLKLDKPLAGKPDLNTQMRWEGVATEFTKTPFALKMDAESAKIEGIQTTPCTPARRSGKSGR